MHRSAILFITTLLCSNSGVKSQIQEADKPDRDENIWMHHNYNVDLEHSARWREFINRTDSELELGKRGFIEEITLWNDLERSY